MEKKYEDVLRKIFDRSEKLGSTHVTEVYTDTEGDKRREICCWLTQQGYIRNVDYRGREVINCDIEFKAIDHFLE